MLEMVESQLGTNWRADVKRQEKEDYENEEMTRDPGAARQLEADSPKEIVVQAGARKEMQQAMKNALQENEMIKIALAKAMKRIKLLEHENSKLQKVRQATESEETAKMRTALVRMQKTNPSSIVESQLNRQSGAAEKRTDHNSPTIPTNHPEERAASGQANSTEQNNLRLNWAKITKIHRPTNGQVPAPLMEKIKKARGIIDQNNMRTRMLPKPVAAYFKNVRRGPIGTLRKALRDCLPAWALLGLCFVGGSVLEIITNQRQKDRLTATLRMMGISEIPNFDITSLTKKPQAEGRNESNTVRNIEAAIRRLEHCSKTCRIEAAMGWYTKKLTEMRLSLETETRREVYRLPQTKSAAMDIIWTRTIQPHAHRRTRTTAGQWLKNRETQ